MTILLVIHIIVTMLLIGIILLQKSEGGGLGTPSSSGNTFSARGTANILTKVTALLAATFMLLCIIMTMISHYKLDTDANIISKAVKD
jgi:preprotein translocase subunit SecG